MPAGTRPSFESEVNVRINFMTSLYLFLALFCFRIFNALSIKTFFQPDEYFQALEPAWAHAFGHRAGAWITWEWGEYLRSSIIPQLFGAVYKSTNQLCQFFDVAQPTRSDILIAIPKIVQAGFASVIDLFTYKFACTIYGEGSSASRTALALTIFSPWQWFCSIRTLSNSIETAFTVFALNLWPWHWLFPDLTTEPKSRNGPQHTLGSTEHGKWRQQLREQQVLTRDKPVPSGVYASLLSAALACILRPTNVLIWAILAAMNLRFGDNYSLLNPASNRKLVQAALVSASIILAYTVSMDRAYYGEWVFPPLRFLYFNVVKSLAVFYGQNRHDYYFTEGMCLLLTTASPFAIIGWWISARDLFPDQRNTTGLEVQIRLRLAMVVLVTLSVLTLISHKEVRFIYPLLPIFHVLAAKPMASFFDPFPFPRKKYRYILLALWLSTSMFIAYYTGNVHQRGVVDVMHYLRHEQEAKLYSATAPGSKVTVGFLMPCHSTPWRSHFVYPNIDAWALTCEPPLHLSASEKAAYLDEADQFYADPILWVNQNLGDGERSIEKHRGDVPQTEDYGLRREWPEYLVFFQQLVPTMEKALQGSRYRECWRGFNTHWHDDWRRHGDVVVWCTHKP